MLAGFLSSIVTLAFLTRGYITRVCVWAGGGGGERSIQIAAWFEFCRANMSNFVTFVLNYSRSTCTKIFLELYIREKTNVVIDCSIIIGDFKLQPMLLHSGQCLNFFCQSCISLWQSIITERMTVLVSS